MIIEVGVEDELEVRDELEVVEFDAHEVDIGLPTAEPTKATRKRVVDACMILYVSDTIKPFNDMIE